MVRYFLELAYDGTNYHGWQIQPNAASVQATINDALHKALRRQVYIIGAGRTDTGVHASYYVAHFETDEPIEDVGFVLHRLNVILPPDVAVYSLQSVAPDLHSRFSAQKRTYKYYLSTRKIPFTRNYCYRPNFKLDFALMNEAASHLLSYHDFTSFARLHADTATNECTVTRAEWTQTGCDEWVFTISANRFLRNMVRAIVGTLIDVGRGRLTVGDFVTIIEAKNRCKASTSAPAQALFLHDIEYPEGFGFVPQKRPQ